MRHYFRFKSFGSSISFRKSLFINLCNSFIKYEFLKSSLFKCKEIRSFLEPLITIGKNFSIFNFKFINSKLNNLESVFKIFKIISPRYKFRNGGYLKIHKGFFKKGDSSPLSFLFFS
ncbi:MAG: 50S ribosomal protein L17 [Candidatus Nasuia deltocephalinicola]